MLLETIPTNTDTLDKVYDLLAHLEHSLATSSQAKSVFAPHEDGNKWNSYLEGYETALRSIADELTNALFS
jgi:hypothetical protein